MAAKKAGERNRKRQGFGEERERRGSPGGRTEEGTPSLRLLKDLGLLVFLERESERGLIWF